MEATVYKDESLKPVPSAEINQLARDAVDGLADHLDWEREYQFAGDRAYDLICILEVAMTKAQKMLDDAARKGE